MGQHERTLRRLEIDAQETELSLLAERLADPDGPLDEALAELALPDDPLRDKARHRLPKIAVLIAIPLALAALWAWTPMAQWLEPARLADATGWLQATWLGPVLGALFLAVATLAMVPIVPLIVVAALLFGPWLGAACAFAGSLLGASAGYLAGRSLLRDHVRKLAGERLNELSRALAKRGVIAMAALRLVPVAPFTVVNLVAGSSHIRLRDFLLGTVVGMTPGIVGLTIAADRVVQAAASPDAGSIGVAVATLLVVGGGIALLRRWLDQATQEAG